MCDFVWKFLIGILVGNLNFIEIEKTQQKTVIKIQENPKINFSKNSSINKQIESASIKIKIYAVKNKSVEVSVSHLLLVRIISGF